MKNVLQMLLVIGTIICVTNFACADDIQDGISRLKNGDEDTREDAAEYLGNVGAGNADVEAALISAMTDPSSDIREEAADALGKVGTSEAVPVLINALKDDSFGVRNSAVKSLGAVGDERAIDPLQEVAANAWNPFVSKEASKSIMKIKSRTGN